MCARSSDEKPALMNEIGEVVLIPALVSASNMSECGIIGETFEIIIYLVGVNQFTNTDSVVVYVNCVVLINNIFNNAFVCEIYAEAVVKYSRSELNFRRVC